MAQSSFLTASGLVVPAITTDQMRNIDRRAIDGVGPNLYQMMENAGRNLAELCTETLGPGWVDSSIVVLAGTGGNGGGGICAARHLANHGGTVTLVLSHSSGLHPVPAEQFALYRATGSAVAEASALDQLSPDLVVDAVLGYSLAGAPRGSAAELIQWMSSLSAPVISLDVPSGLDATTGSAPGVCVTAAVTMTLALPKTGLDTDAVGALCVADLGIPASVLHAEGLTQPHGLFANGYRVWLERVRPPLSGPQVPVSVY